MSSRNKLAKAFGEGAFGEPDVPLKVGRKFQTWVGGHEWLGSNGRDDRRSWKRRRKTRWRAK